MSTLYYKIVMQKFHEGFNSLPGWYPYQANSVYRAWTNHFLEQLSVPKKKKKKKKKYEDIQAYTSRYSSV